MEIMPNDCVRTHKLQRYLYHFTDKRHYELMQLLDNQINSGKKDAFGLNGIFMVDLENFKNQWLNTNYCFCGTNENIAYSLLEHIKRGGQDIVCIRIPVKNLDAKKLRIRDQIQFFDANYKNKTNRFTNHVYNGDDIIYRDRYCNSKKPIEYIYTGENISLDKADVVIETQIPADMNFNTKDTIQQRKNIICILKQLFSNLPEKKGFDKVI